METLLRPELSLALIAGIMFLLFCYYAESKYSLGLIVCLIPFQAMDTQYGTLNVLLVYLVGVAFALRGRIRYVPLIWNFAFIFAAYIISVAFAHPSTRFDSLLYLFNLGSAVVLFYLVYNHIRAEGGLSSIIRMMVVMNVLVLLYCTVQTVFGQVSLFGIHDLSVLAPRGDGRLRGPFDAVGITAEFIVLSILLFVYMLVDAKTTRVRVGLYALVGMNLLFLMATANRGGFLVLVACGGLFLLRFRRQLGTARAVGLGLMGVVLIAVASIAVMTFTDYQGMFDRLEATEINEEGIPDSRVNVWSDVLPRLQERLAVGHGPYFYTEEAPYPGYVLIPYPHSLYLYLLFTGGILGTIAWAFFFSALFLRLWSATRMHSDGSFDQGVAKVGLLLLLAFLIDQLKIEFLRMELIDYWHFLFLLFALLVAAADRVRLGIVGAAGIERSYRTTPRPSIGGAVAPAPSR